MGFERCHPAVNLIYFASVIAGMASFRHPVFLLICFACACAYSIRRNRGKGAVFDLCMIPLAAAFALYYGSSHHFGITVLKQNFIGNNMTLESAVYGGVLGLSLTGIFIWMSCVHSVFSTDKVVYLFGRVSPRLSLFLAILLRMVPRIKREAKRIHTAQKGVGRGMGQGNPWQRLKNALRILSVLITWTIESLTTASDSMGSRGSSLRGRTAFSVYRFDNRDRGFVLTLFCFLTLTLMAVILGQTDMVYAPRILWKSVDALFCVGYLALCMMPLVLELWTDYRFKKARRTL